MACFIVPAAEAIVVTAAALVMKKKEQKLQLQAPKLDCTGADEIAEKSDSGKPSFSRKLGWLAKLLWGGVVLLAFEHLWHGEIVPFPPFLTAVSSPGAVSAMLAEMASVGTTMAAVVTAAWGMLCAFADIKFKRAKTLKAEKSSSKEQ